MQKRRAWLEKKLEIGQRFRGRRAKHEDDLIHLRDVRKERKEARGKERERRKTSNDDNRRER